MRTIDTYLTEKLVINKTTDNISIKDELYKIIKRVLKNNWEGIKENQYIISHTEYANKNAFIITIIKAMYKNTLRAIYNDILFEAHDFEKNIIGCELGNNKLTIFYVE